MRARLAAIEDMLVRIPGLYRRRSRSGSSSRSRSASGSGTRSERRGEGSREGRYREHPPARDHERREREREREYGRDGERRRDRDGDGRQRELGREMGRQHSRDDARRRVREGRGSRDMGTRAEREGERDGTQRPGEQRFWGSRDEHAARRSHSPPRSRPRSASPRTRPRYDPSPSQVVRPHEARDLASNPPTQSPGDAFTPHSEPGPASFSRPPLLPTPSASGAAPTPAAPTSASRFAFTYDAEAPAPAQDESYGTLVIDRSGRSKWLGPTAGTEWLKNQEVDGSPATSRRTSGTSPHRGASPPPRDFGFGEDSLFPFPAWGPPPTMETIMLHLPPLEEAAVLVDSYFRNYTWNHDVAPRGCVQPIFDRAYDLGERDVDDRKRRERRVSNGADGDTAPNTHLHPQQLALLFIILAMGALHNPDLPPHDPSAEHHLASARWCLVKGDFIGNNTIAGLQALVIMAHYHLETEKGRNGDSAWPLWGLAMRLVTAMGLHIDGKRWNLPPEVAEERRHVFWECHTIDVFQANCFSRPNSLRPEHIDTEFPNPNSTDAPGKSFRTLKFELCRISGA